MDLNSLKIFSEKLRSYNQILLIVIDIFSYLLSFLFILAFVYEHGFMVGEKGINRLNVFYEFVWISFLLINTIRIVFEYRKIKKSLRSLGWVLSVLLYFTIIPLSFNEPQAGLFRYLWLFFHSHSYLVTILFLLSFFQLSYGLVRILGRKTNPSLILGSSFFIIIIIGTGLFLLPRSTIDGIHWSDALFMATSAVCVTGLASVDIPSTFTLEGQIIIICLVQLGGIGVMTFTSFFGLFFMGHTSLYNQLAVRDMINSDSLNGLFSTLLNILVFTLCIEFVGMIFLFIDIHNRMGLELTDEIRVAVFHGVSGFCNAGFSIFSNGLSNEELIHGHRLFYLTTAFLIILGSIGFPILANIRRIPVFSFLPFGRKFLRKKFENYNPYHLFNLNTKIVLIVTLILILVGSISIGFLEWDNSLSEFNRVDKIVHSFFNAVSLRTAGFNSVEISSMRIQVFLLVIILMIIGGGAQSTAGGIKVNTFAVIILNLWAVIKGKEYVDVFGRELSSNSIRRANATMLIFILALFCSLFIMSFLESDIPLLELSFECASALSTSGSSLGITSKVSVEGKIVLSILMFMGRVGIITLLWGLIRQKGTIRYKYPKEDIIIN